MVPELLVLALDFHRTPLAFRHLTDPKQPLPEAFEALLGDFASALSPQQLEATAATLGRDPADIEEAARFFVRQVLLTPGADHYRILGLSRQAPEAAVRQHYRWLVRLFHPDRSNGECVLDVTYTARINDAYNTLRDPEARRRYDRRLPKAKRPGAPQPGPATFFRPAPPIAVDHATGVPRASTLPSRWQRIAFWTLTGAVAVGAALVLLRAVTQPVLRSNPANSTPVTPGPSYLSSPTDPTGIAAATRRSAAQAPPSADAPATREASARRPPDQANTPADVGWAEERSPAQPLVGDATPPANTPRPARAVPPPPAIPADPLKAPAKEAARTKSPPPSAPKQQAAPPAPAPATAKKADDTTPSDKADKQANRGAGGPAATPKLSAASPPASAPSAVLDTLRAVEIADDLVRRLASAYRRGDLPAFVSLFASNARVNEGRGTAFIRKDYADFFARTPERSLQVQQIRWRPAGDGRLVGTALVRAEVRDKGSFRPRRLAGSLELELVPSGDGFRIAKLLHTLSPR